MPRFNVTAAKRLASLGLVSLMLSPAVTLAARIQNFTGINYQNPASLVLTVQKYQFIAGDTFVMPNIAFDGTVTTHTRFPAPFNVTRTKTSTGYSHSKGVDNIPYGRIAARLSPQWVAGVDVTDPYASNITYSEDSNIRYAGTRFVTQSADIAPNLAYQFTGKLSRLSVGAGLDALYVTTDLDQMYPAPLSPTGSYGTGGDAEVTNHLSGWGYGYHMGLNYQLFKTTLVGLTYFSQMTPNLTGKSTYTGYATRDDVRTSLKLPATVRFTVAQGWNSKWVSSFNVIFSNWSRMNNVYLEDTAGPTSTGKVITNYKNTWRYSIENAYQYTPKLKVGNMIAYDWINGSPSTRGPIAPASNNVSVGLFAEYKITKAVTGRLEYGHSFYPQSAKVDYTANNGTTSSGTADVHMDAIGARITIDLD